MSGDQDRAAGYVMLVALIVNRVLRSWKQDHQVQQKGTEWIYQMLHFYYALESKRSGADNLDQRQFCCTHVRCPPLSHASVPS